MCMLCILDRLMFQLLLQYGHPQLLALEILRISCMIIYILTFDDSLASSVCSFFLILRNISEINHFDF